MITTENEFHNKVKQFNHSLQSNDSAIANLLIKDERHPLFIRTSSITADCLQCQSEIEMDDDGNFLCPVCGSPYQIIDIDNWNAGKQQRAGYCSTIEIIDGILVLRCWEFNLKYAPTYLIKWSYVNEVCRFWFSVDGHERITRVPKSLGLYFYFMKPCVISNKRESHWEKIADNSLLLQYPEGLKAFHINFSAKGISSAGILNKIRTCLNTVHNSCKKWQS